MDTSIIKPDEFANRVAQLILNIKQTQGDAMNRAAKLIYTAIEGGHRFYVTGTGHSHMIAEEFYARAGGLAVVTPMLPDEFMLHVHPLKSTLIERIPEYAKVILGVYPIQKGDVVLVTSNSGRNGLPVELCLAAKEIGAAVIAVTSYEGMKGQKSRHPSGKKIGDIADVVIDNCGVEGDATCDINCGGLRMGATSTVAGAYIAQEIGMAVAGLYVENGETPPVFTSSNVDNADARNRELFAKYYNI